MKTTDRPPTRITVQFRRLPYRPDQVTVTRHYGRGIPQRRQHITRRHPELSDDFNGTAWTDYVADRIRDLEDCPVVVLRPEITRY